MQFFLIRTVFLKELREILRDRRTLLLMVGIPVFLYPALFVLMEQVMLFGRGNLIERAPRVAVYQPGGGGYAVPLRDSETLQVVAVSSADASSIQSGRFDAILIVDSIGPPIARSLDVQIIYDASRDRSLRARALVSSRLDTLNSVTLSNRLERFGLPPEFARPIAVRDSSVATPRGLGGAALGRFLPMVLILMTVLGAFHPAIDIAAGERERKTLEPLLTTSASAGAIVSGKYLAVATIAFTAAALNLASMLLTLNAGIFQFAGELQLEFDLPPRAIVLTLFLLALLALLFAALFLGVAVHAQSFREAQTSLTPIYLVSFLPAIVTMAPGIEFSVPLSVVPVAGVAMLFRALMVGEAVGLEGFLAVAATIAYASFALSFAARSFAGEDVLLGDDDAAEVRARGRLPWWNSDGAPTPSARTALVFIGIVGLLFFYLGRIFAGLGEPGIFAAQWALLALPTVLLIRFGKFRWREALAIRAVPNTTYLAAVLIILGGLPLSWLLAWVQTFVLELPEEFLAGMQGLLTATDPARLIWLLLLVAVTPAICEELVFRGILLQSLGRRLAPAAAVIGSAVIFGVFHLSFETAIRLLPTAFLGGLLGLVALRSASVLPSMLMHFINNATAVVLISSPTLQGLVGTTESGPNWALIVLGALLLSVGLWVLLGRTPSSYTGRAFSREDAAAVHS